MAGLLRWWQTRPTTCRAITDCCSARGIGNRIIRRRGGNGSSNTRRYVVERSNAIVKRWCGGGRARYWGLEKVAIQMLLASIAANLKRWLGLVAPAACPTV